jgi:hypothetical protein
VRKCAAGYTTLYGSGQAISERDRLASVVAAGGLVGASTIESEAASLRATFEAQADASPMPAASEPAAASRISVTAIPSG